jgi:hypothetical protein
MDKSDYSMISINENCTYDKMLKRFKKSNTKLKKYYKRHNELYKKLFITSIENTMDDYITMKLQEKTQSTDDFILLDVE